MSRALKRTLLVIAGAAVLVLLAASVLLLFVDVDRLRPRLEREASRDLGMDVRFGRLRAGLFPTLHLTAEDGRILDPGGVAVASAKRTRLGIRLLPLLHGEIRLSHLDVVQPQLTIERDAAGAFNTEGLGRGAQLLGVLDGATLSIRDASVRFTDVGSGNGVVVSHGTLSASRIRLGRGAGPPDVRGLSVRGKFSCGEIRSKRLTIAGLAGSVSGQDGVLELSPVTMQLFGTQANGSLRADLSVPVPRIQLRFSLPRFRVEEFLKSLSPKRGAEGRMDFRANLTLQGSRPAQWLESAAGEMSLRGRDLTLVDNDLDRALARFASSQGFNLVDVGAVLFAGPIGLAVTRGYSFASMFRGSGGDSHVAVLVSDWKLERGIAHAQDVAMSTPKNRIALQGGLDFVHQRFVDVTVAVVDNQGCATVHQVIHGSFEQPVVEKPHVITSLAGPVLKLVRQTRGLFPGGPCEVFYSGSVQPPD